MYKRFSILIIVRVVLLIINVQVLMLIFGDPRLFFNQIILGIILVIQVAELIRFVNHTNRELARLFLAIKHSDFSITFRHGSMGKSFKALQDSMMEIIQAYKQVKIEKEAQYHFLQMMVKQIHVGIISLEGDTVTLINPTAEQLLNISGLKNWKLILHLHPQLAHEFGQLGDNGRKLIELRSKDETKILSVDVSTQIILDKPHKLITLQDINSEIEQKEIEAWHKLIRILTHEIMNSVTPIASLTETLQGMLTDKQGQQKELSSITDETVSDIRFSLNTIHKRSEGLLDFVESYRRLTKVPKPVPETISIKTFLGSVEHLMKDALLRQGIHLVTHVRDEDLTATFDPKLIEQVIINLITNSSHALEGRPGKTISLKAYVTDKSAVAIEVTDNGKGIPEKALKEIFVPFFSTKKDGSGIGLSLSKQIMSLHGGSIKVHSQVDEGTTFVLTFRKA